MDENLFADVSQRKGSINLGRQTSFTTGLSLGFKPVKQEFIYMRSLL